MPVHRVALFFLSCSFLTSAVAQSNEPLTANTTQKFLVLFNDSTQHHWDFATEGITSALFLKNRPEKTAANQVRNFRMMNDLLLRFFDRFLKGGENFTLSTESPTIINLDGL